MEQEGDGEKRGVEEMNSLVSVLFTVEECSAKFNFRQTDKPMIQIAG